MRNFKIYLFATFSFLPFLNFSQSTFFTGGNICGKENWILTFNDEFDEDSLDRSVWINYFPYSASGDDQCEYCRTHGQEGQIFTDTNLEVSNGTLKLIARKQTATWFSASREYTSAIIHTRNDFKFHYGRFESRCKIPGGKGLYSAFWLFGGDNIGTAMEIDIFEFQGRIAGHHHMALWKYAETELTGGHSYTYADNDFSKDFHIYSVEWDPFFITFKVDESEVYKISRLYTLAGTKVDWCCVTPGVYGVLDEYPKGENTRVSIISGLSIQTGTEGPDENTIFPAQFEVDYIRVYQRDTVEHNNYECEVFLYPNPVSSILKIRKNRMTKINIENIHGQVLSTKNVSGDEADMDVSNLRQGMYFVEVNSDDGTFGAKFIKN